MSISGNIGGIYFYIKENNIFLMTHEQLSVFTMLAVLLLLV